MKTISQIELEALQGTPNDTKVAIYRPTIKVYTDDFGDLKAYPAMVESGEHRDKFVTHADYKALEERTFGYWAKICQQEGDIKCLSEKLASLKALEGELFEATCSLTQQDEKIADLEVELASLKARVGELVEADRAYDARTSDGPGLEGGIRAVVERRRIALETLK